MRILIPRRIKYMARIVNLEGDARKELCKALSRSFQSGHTNFLLGSGASLPAVPIAGPIEAEIAELIHQGRDDVARGRMYEFLASVRGPTNRLIEGLTDDKNATVVANYAALLATIETILTERR